MNNQDDIQTLLAQMHDIALPDTLAWWESLSLFFWAGLYLLAALIVACVLVVVFLRRSNRVKRHALKQLKTLKENQSSSVQHAFKEVNTLLKQYIFTIRPSLRSELSSIYGIDWYGYLQATLPPKAQGKWPVNLDQMNAWQELSLTGEKSDLTPQKQFIEFAESWLRHSNATLCKRPDSIAQTFKTEQG